MATASAGDELSATDASALLDSGQLDAAAVVDVRLAGEYRLDGHVRGSTNIPAFDWEHGFYVPHARFTEEVLAEVGDHSARLVLVCSDGVRSASAAGVLAAAGFANCAVLAGGLRAWEAEELPTEVDEDGEGGLVGAWV